MSYAHSTSIERLRERAAELAAEEFRKAHPCLGFLANEPACIRKLNLSKSTQIKTALFKSSGMNGFPEAEMPTTYGAAVEQFMAAEVGSARQFELAKVIRRLMGSERFENRCGKL